MFELVTERASWGIPVRLKKTCTPILLHYFHLIFHLYVYQMGVFLSKKLIKTLLHWSQSVLISFCFRVEENKILQIKITLKVSSKVQINDGIHSCVCCTLLVWFVS